MLELLLQALIIETLHGCRSDVQTKLSLDVRVRDVIIIMYELAAAELKRM